MMGILNKLSIYEDKLKEIKRLFYRVCLEENNMNFWEEYLFKELHGIRRNLDFHKYPNQVVNNIELEISNLDTLINKYKSSLKKLNDQEINYDALSMTKKLNGFTKKNQNETKNQNLLPILLSIFHKLKKGVKEPFLTAPLIHKVFLKVTNGESFKSESLNINISEKEVLRITKLILEDDVLYQDLLNSFPFGSFTKAVYNHFFSKDLYGKYDNEKDNIILSSGSLAESEFPLSFTLKNCIDYAVTQDYVGYSHSLGLEQTRDAIVFMENLLLSTGEGYKNSNVAITMGGQAGINLISEYFKDLFSSNDEVIMLIPNYAPFMHLFEKNFKVKYVSYMKETDELFTKIKEMITSKTKLVVLVDVTNPTGIKIKKESLERIIEFAKERNIYLLIDEAGKCYLDRDYGSPENLSEDNVIRVRSLSKSHGIPGLKVGYIIASSKIINNLYGLISASYGAPNAIFYTLLEFVCKFEGYRLSGSFNLTEKELKSFNNNYGLTLEALNIMYQEYVINQKLYEDKILRLKEYTMSMLNPFLGTLIDEIIYPEGSLNICIKVNSSLSSYDFFLKLLRQKKVAVFPGICFGIYEGCWIRITFTVSKDDLERGLSLLLDFLKEEYMLDYISGSASFNQLLVIKGKYTFDPDVNFLSHLYNVGLTMDLLLENIPIERRKLFDRETLENLILIHDAGKVISVYINRYSRLIKFSETPLKDNTIKELENYNDKEILYSKQLLKNTMTSDIILPEFLNGYSKLIKVGVKHNIADTFITNQILKEFLEYNNTEDEKLVESIKLFLENSDDIHLKLLDLSDKLSDYYYQLKGENLSEEIIKVLDKKQEYVLWRYGRDGANEDLIQKDFEKAKDFTKEIFKINTPEILSI